MPACNFNHLDVDSATNRLCEVIKETGGIDDAVKYISPQQYAILFQLLKKYRETYPSFAPENLSYIDHYLNSKNYNQVVEISDREFALVIANTGTKVQGITWENLLDTLKANGIKDFMMNGYVYECRENTIGLKQML